MKKLFLITTLILMLIAPFAWGAEVTRGDMVITGDLRVGGIIYTDSLAGIITTPLSVPQGGTGAATIADGGLVIGNAAGAIEADVAGLTTQILVGGGALTKPVWTTATGTGAPVRATSPTLVTPALGTPGSGTLTSCTGLPISTGVSGLAANIATFLGTPSSANLASALTDETGTLLSVFSDSPALTTVASITKTAIGITQSDAYGLGILNTTAAAAGAQQYSPPLVFRGSGWKTDATAASQKVEFLMDVRPEQGAAAPTGYLGIYPSINDAAYSATPAIAVASAGNIRINTNGNQVGAYLAKVQIEGVGATPGTLSILNNVSTDVPGMITLGSSRGASGTPTIISASDSLGRIYFVGADGNDYQTIGAAIIARSYGTVGADRIPGELQFYTATNAAPSVLTQRFLIDNGGNFGFNITTFGTSAAKVLGIGNGTAPTTRPADMVQMWAADALGVAGDSRLYILGEAGTGLVVLGNGEARADAVVVKNTTEGGTAGFNIKSARELHTLAAAATSDTTLNIPSGALLLGASFCVNTAITTSAASNTWDADYIGGSTTNLVTAGASGALNTKSNRLIVPEVASAQTNIQFAAPGAETFTAGVIEIIVYYIDTTSLANA